jgi:hypothetical protein
MQLLNNKNILAFLIYSGLFFDLTLSVIGAILSQISGINGFSVVPYIRACTYPIYISIIVYIVFKNRKLTIFNGLHGFSLPITIMIGMTALGAVMGLINENPIVYIIANTIYLITCALYYLASRDFFANEKSNVAEAAKNILPISIAYLSLCIFMQEKSAIGIAHGVCSFAVIFLSGFEWTAILSFPIILTGVIFADKASLISLVAILAAIASQNIKRAKSTLAIIVTLVIFVVSLFLAMKLFPEASLIQRIDKVFDGYAQDRIIDNDPTMAQRNYEMGAAIKEIETNHPITGWLVGAGTGATIDLSQTPDDSVTSAALINDRQIHNIHYFPVAIIYRYGIPGMAFTLLLYLTCITSLIKAMKSNYPPSVFASLYISFLTVTSFTGASFFFTTPSIFIAMGFLDANEQKRMDKI